MDGEQKIFQLSLANSELPFCVVRHRLVVSYQCRELLFSPNVSVIVVCVGNVVLHGTKKCITSEHGVW